MITSIYGIWYDSCGSSGEMASQATRGIRLTGVISKLCRCGFLVMEVASRENLGGTGTEAHGTARSDLHHCSRKAEKELRKPSERSGELPEEQLSRNISKAVLLFQKKPDDLYAWLLFCGALESIGGNSGVFSRDCGCYIDRRGPRGHLCDILTGSAGTKPSPCTTAVHTSPLQELGWCNLS